MRPSKKTSATKKNLLLTGFVVIVHLFFFFFDFNNKSCFLPQKKSIIVNTFISSPSPKPKTTSQTSKTIEKTKPNIHLKKTEILKELKASLTKIDSPLPAQKATTLILPKKIKSLQIDQTKDPRVSSYLALLTQILKEELELPEYGDVKLELTALNNGKILKIKVLHATSEKNRRYLESNLLRVALPSFDDTFENEREHVFTLTFCNEI